MQAFSINDRAGRLVLTVLVGSKADATRAIDVACPDTHAPYTLSQCPAQVARSALRDWRSGWTTDKAVDLTTNAGWDEL